MPTWTNPDITPDELTIVRQIITGDGVVIPQDMAIVIAHNRSVRGDRPRFTSLKELADADVRASKS